MRRVGKNRGVDIDGGQPEAEVCVGTSNMSASVAEVCVGSPKMDLEDSGGHRSMRRESNTSPQGLKSV